MEILKCSNPNMNLRRVTTDYVDEIKHFIQIDLYRRLSAEFNSSKRVQIGCVGPIEEWCPDVIGE